MKLSMYEKEMKDLEKKVDILRSSSDPTDVEKMKKQNAELHKNITVASNMLRTLRIEFLIWKKSLKKPTRLRRNI